MDTFAELRKRAREIRDSIVAEARAEYADRLVRIATLERELWASKVRKGRRLTTVIESVIPKDRQFTTDDVYAGLEALDDRRSFKKGFCPRTEWHTVKETNGGAGVINSK